MTSAYLLCILGVPLQARRQGDGLTTPTPANCQGSLLLGKSPPPPWLPKPVHFLPSKPPTGRGKMNRVFIVFFACQSVLVLPFVPTDAGTSAHVTKAPFTQSAYIRSKLLSIKAVSVAIGLALKNSSTQRKC